MLCDFSRCQLGIHPFIVISSSTVGIDEEKVVRWCPECGAITVDCDVDNSVMPGYYKKLKYPNITKKYGLSNKPTFDVEEFKTRMQKAIQNISNRKNLRYEPRHLVLILHKIQKMVDEIIDGKKEGDT